MSKVRTTKINKADIRGLPTVTIPNEPKKGFPISEEKIEALKQFASQRLLFSYRFLDIEHEAFNLGNTGEVMF